MIIQEWARLVLVFGPQPVFSEEVSLMPKRKIDPATGEPELTYREQRLVDQFVKNGGNGLEDVNKFRI